MMDHNYDIAIVGAGIVGLAHALAAAKRGKRVVVLERDHRAVGASIRNFGFVTITGQAAGKCWERAHRSRDIWAEVAPAAGIEVVHQGVTVVAQRPEAMALLEDFATTDMAEDCTLLSAGQLASQLPQARHDAAMGGLFSPHELRVESRDAIPQLASWLEQAWHVTFLWGTAVHAITLPTLATSIGGVRAEQCVVCAGDDFRSLFPERFAAYEVQRCKLQMLRVNPPASFARLPSAVMSDLSLIRYPGYAEREAAAPLRAQLEQDCNAALAHGIHLIVVQSSDGSLVVGDSHHTEDTPDGFIDSTVEQLILDELRRLLALPTFEIQARWVGTYGTSSTAGPLIIDRPSENLRLVSVTSGTGASTAFGIAEDVIGELS